MALLPIHSVELGVARRCVCGAAAGPSGFCPDCDEQMGGPAVTGPIEPCNHTSVGVLVARDGRLLLINRASPPYGWAPPAGHVEPGETYGAAAARELAEETGLHAADLRHLISKRYPNRCRRPGGDHHDWAVYEADVVGHPVLSPEIRGWRWASAVELADLVTLTRAHLASDATPEQWKEHPGLEPVWVELLGKLGWISGRR